MSASSFLVRLRHGAALALLTVLAACGGARDVPADRVQTASGPVDAVMQNGMLAYRKIPYAAPPVGALRWKAPADPQPWTAAISSETSANTCPQNGSSPFVIPSTNEDCLYLDVFTPEQRSAKRPVMVWIHGGAFLTGGAVTYGDPSQLVSRGVIVVNINYRLGVFGFLAHPALVAEQGGSAGNYGIMDQQKALQWVQTNIGKFGGDPGNVTIFGESAGGFSVMTHLASPLSKGMFAKAIVHSGAYAINLQPTLASAETNATSVIDNTLTAAGSTCSGGVTTDCLRSIPTSAIGTLMTEYGKLNSSPVPIVDGRVLPKSVKATFIAGENNKVPMINGSNRDEWALFVAINELTARAAVSPPNTDPTNTSFALSAAGYPFYITALTGAPSGSAAQLGLLAAYPLASYGSNTAQQPSLAATALGTDLIFACPALRVSQRAANQGNATWMYEFRDRTAIPFVGRDATTGAYQLSFPQGAAHSYELQYIFNLNPLANDEQRTLAAAMATYWTNFASNSDPNSGNSVPVTWPNFTTASPSVLGLDIASDGGIAVMTDFDTAHKCSTVWGTAVTF